MEKQERKITHKEYLQLCANVVAASVANPYGEDNAVVKKCIRRVNILLDELYYEVEDSVMKREFKKGEVIFHYNHLNEDLHGFGKILKDTIAEGNDSIVLIEANLSGECETTADRIYRVDEHLQCCRCGCVVVDEWEGDIDYPYFCPDCDKNKYRIEVTQVDDEDWDEVLRDSIGRFLPEEE